MCWRTGKKIFSWQYPDLNPAIFLKIDHQSELRILFFCWQNNYFPSIIFLQINNVFDLIFFLNYKLIFKKIFCLQFE